MIPLRLVPEWVMKSAHRKADETGTEHACVFRASDSGWGSDSAGGCWAAVALGTVSDESWMRSPYVAIPNELDEP